MADFDSSIYRVQPRSVTDYDNDYLANQNNRLALLLQQENVNNAPVRADTLRLQLQGAQLANQQTQQGIQVAAPILQRIQARMQAQGGAAPAAPGASAVDPAVVQAHAAQLQSLAGVNTPQDALKWAQAGLGAGVFDRAHYQQGVAALAQAASDPAAFAQWKQQTAASMQQGQALFKQGPAQAAATSAGVDFPMTFDEVNAMKILGRGDFLPNFKTALEGVSRAPGSEVTDVNGNRRTIPVLDKGQTLDPSTNTISNIPGFVAASAQAAGATAGATTAAQEQAKAPYTLVDSYDPAQGRSIKTPLSTLLQGPQGAAPATQAFQGSALLDQASPATRATILADAAKTGNRQFNVALNTPSGAVVQGPVDRTAVAPAAAAPIAPAVGIPAGPSASEKAAQDASAAAQKDAATAAVKLATQPEIESQTDQAKGAAANATKYQADLHNEVAENYKLVARNQALLPLLTQFPTGGFGADQRSKIGNEIANTQMLPDDLKAKLGAWVAGGDPATGRVIANQLAAAGIVNLVDTLPQGDKPNRIEYQALAKAAEGLDSGKSTLEGVFAQQKRIYDQVYKEQQALNGAVKNGTFNPKTWQGDYSATRNAALNAPPASATNGLPSMSAIDAEIARRAAGKK